MFSVDLCLIAFSSHIKNFGWALGAHACNTICSGGRDLDD
jgi:hypothetical protein